MIKKLGGFTTFEFLKKEEKTYSTHRVNRVSGSYWAKQILVHVRFFLFIGFQNIHTQRVKNAVHAYISVKKVIL